MKMKNRKWKRKYIWVKYICKIQRAQNGGRYTCCCMSVAKSEIELRTLLTVTCHIQVNRVRSSISHFATSTSNSERSKFILCESPPFHVLGTQQLPLLSSNEKRGSSWARETEATSNTKCCACEIFMITSYLHNRILKSVICHTVLFHYIFLISNSYTFLFPSGYLLFYFSFLHIHFILFGNSFSFLTGYRTIL